MVADSLFTALRGVTGVILLAIAVYIYVSLIRQVRSRASTILAGPERDLGLPEGILALLLVSVLLCGTVLSFRAQPVDLDSRTILKNLVVTAMIVLLIALFLVIRGFNLASLGGFYRISFLRAVTTGIVLIVAAYPLMILADGISQSLLGEPNRQSIVEFFTASSMIKQRVMIIVFAVAVAPVIEEFLFRVFLYRVFRRYFGVLPGMISNALLFAVVHAHLPSLAPLFALGLCLTIAFEWSGSILVSMTMHSLFNASQLTALAFPELLQQ